MNDLTPFLGFAVVSLLVALTPGPSWVYVISSTLANGRRGGFAAAAGNSTGILCHAVAAVLGLSTILQVSSVAFTVVKYLGVAYLLYLAARLVMQDPAAEASVREVRTVKPASRIFRDGVLVNVLNPKISLLMLSLVPQFIDPGASSPQTQIAAMGGLHAVIAGLVHTHVVLLSGSLFTRIRDAARVQRVMRWAMAAMFFGLGLRLAFAGRN